MNRILIILTLWILSIINACIPTKQLADNEYLLYSQKIKGNKHFNDEELEAFSSQKPNRKILYLPISPYLYIYNIGHKIYLKNYKKDSLLLLYIKNDYREKIEKLQSQLDSLKEILSHDKKKYASFSVQTERLVKKRNRKIEKLERRIREGNWLMRVVGEAPVLYDSSSTDATLELMEKYMHQNGYFSAKVSTQERIIGKLLYIDYIIIENLPHTIRKLQIDIQDTVLYKIVMPYIHSLKVLDSGQIYTQKDLEALRLNTTDYLKDRGYFEFSEDYIFFEVDTNQHFLQLDIKFIIKNPSQDSKHRQYYIEEIVFDSNTGIRKKKLKADTTLYQQINYIEREKNYDKKLLNDLIVIRKDSLYNVSMTKSTQNALAGLEHFKFVNINYRKNTQNTVKVNIFSSPYEKYQFSTQGGLNITQMLPGPFFNFILKTRNFLGGFEILELNTRISVEAQSATTRAEGITSQQYGGNLSLIFPKVLFPFSKKFRKKLHSFSLRTRLQAGLAYVERSEYSRINLNMSLGYQWKNKANRSFDFKLWEVNVVNTQRLSENFQQRLEDLSDRGNNLILGFDNSLVSGINFVYTQRKNFHKPKGNQSRFFLLRTELGGGVATLLNQILNKEEGFLFGLRYYRFYKISLDYRLAYPISKYSQVAMRMAGGIIQPVGGTISALPYEKHFFSGGSYSNRGWQARRVGPGAYRPEVNEGGFFDYGFEQPGEVNIEYNLELRTRLIGKLHGAIFLDASNVWTVNEDINHPGSQFLIDSFWKQFAIATGLGLRFDFFFLIIRLDWASKIYDPARPQPYRFIGNKLLSNFPRGEKGQTLLNIGIGYPF